MFYCSMSGFCFVPVNSYLPLSTDPKSYRKSLLSPKIGCFLASSSHLKYHIPGALEGKASFLRALLSFHLTYQNLVFKTKGTKSIFSGGRGWKVGELKMSKQISKHLWSSVVYRTTYFFKKRSR